MSPIVRADFNFEELVKEAFAFLDDLGFSVIEESSTLVRYRKNSVEVDIYHGRQSYEIGAGITAFGARYAISEIIETLDPNTADQFRYPMATTRRGIVIGLELLSSLMERFGKGALKGDSDVFAKLERQRKRWSEKYELEVLAEQLRPKAQAAFRRKDYPTAADLYSRIQECLSPSEIKKLRFAEEHREA